LLQQAGTPAILVTHDRTDALALGDDVVVMHAGRIAQRGPVQEVFSRPASFQVAEILSVETVHPGRVIETGELATVTVGRHTLKALGGDLPPESRDVFVCIRAEDVVLMKGGPAHSSPRNCLEGIVKEITPLGAMSSVELDCSFTLRALITRQACEELALKNGDIVQALVKAPQVHLVPRQLMGITG
jgi:molybdate transport system ATP-binding protein